MFLGSDGPSGIAPIVGASVGVPLAPAQDELARGVDFPLFVGGEQVEKTRPVMAGSEGDRPPPGRWERNR